MPLSDAEKKQRQAVHDAAIKRKIAKALAAKVAAKQAKMQGKKLRSTSADRTKQAADMERRAKAVEKSGTGNVRAADTFRRVGAIRSLQAEGLRREEKARRTRKAALAKRKR